MQLPTRHGSAVRGVRKLPVPRGLGSIQVSLGLQQNQASSCIHPCLCWDGADCILGTRSCHPRHTNASKNWEKTEQEKLGKLCWLLPRWLGLCWTNTAVLFSPCGILSGTKQTPQEAEQVGEGWREGTNQLWHLGVSGVSVGRGATWDFSLLALCTPWGQLAARNAVSKCFLAVCNPGDLCETKYWNALRILMGNAF